MLVLADKARSSQLLTAAQFLVGGWIASVAIWRWVAGDWRPYGFALIDFTLAGAFLLMSRGKWFPVPLFFLHAALVFYHAYALLIGSPLIWIGVFLNRAFEAALIYVAGCALWRIRRMAQKD